METEETGKTQEEAAKAEKDAGPKGFPEMCRQMMAGEMPSCCGTQMKDVMAQWMSRLQTKEGK